MHGDGEPSAWITRWSHLIPQGGSVLDVACGGGRHLRWLRAQGFAVTGVDRDGPALAPLMALGEIVEADIENGPWPFDGRCFDAVVVTNYLWRALMPALLASLADGGVLLYETFSTAQASIGKPTRPEFLLQPGELIEIARGLRIVAFEEGFVTGPDRFVQRIAACRSPSAQTLPSRYLL